MTVYTSRFGFQWNYAPHDTGWGTAFNLLHRSVAILLHPTIISDTVTTPPAGPAEDDAYFLPVGVVGAWSTNANKIAAYQGGAWQYYTPLVGTRIYIVSRDGFFWWNGTSLTPEVTSGAGGTFVQTVAGHLPDLAGNVALVIGDIAGAAPLSSPAFTGVPQAPTAAVHTNNTQIATTNYVDRAITALGGISSVAAGTGIAVTFSSGVYTVSLSGSYASTSYVDTAVAGRVAKIGDTMSGVLTLAADPTANLQAATKQYVDTRAARLQAQWVGGAIATNGTIYFVYDAPANGTINALTSLTGNGSFSVAVQINGTNVTGLSAVSVGTTPATATASAANVFTAGQRITGVISGATGSPTDALLSLAVTWKG